MEFRRMIRWTMGAWMAVMAVSAAHGQDNAAAAETPLRPAYDVCVKASRGVTLALNNCIGTEYDFQNKQLNAAYQRLRASLSDSQRIALRDEERAWIAQRDKTCAPDGSGDTASMLDTNQCRLDQTAARAAVLDARTGQ
jgi:uncharacterized protein YecT (DUF1311 family)